MPLPLRGKRERVNQRNALPVSIRLPGFDPQCREWSRGELLVYIAGALADAREAFARGLGASIYDQAQSVVDFLRYAPFISEQENVGDADRWEFERVGLCQTGDTTGILIDLVCALYSSRKLIVAEVLPEIANAELATYVMETLVLAEIAVEEVCGSQTEQTEIAGQTKPGEPRRMSFVQEHCVWVRGAVADGVWERERKRIAESLAPSNVVPMKEAA